MRKTLIETIKKYRDCRYRLKQNLLDNLIPTSTPVLVSSAGMYGLRSIHAQWISGAIVKYWGDRVTYIDVKVNAIEWDKNKLTHCYHYSTPRYASADSGLEIVVRVPKSCVQADRSRLCRLTDYPHHPDFIGNAVPYDLLNKELNEYNQSQELKKRLQQSKP